MNKQCESNRQLQDCIELIDAGGEPRAVYQFSPSLPKPCIHPLVTPSGVIVSGFEMSDHLWHRGLWFTIKLINGTNFWEENEPFGSQISLESPAFSRISETRSCARHNLQWTSAATGPVFDESRTILVEQPNADGIGAIDFSTTLVAKQDLILDRTPFTTWGGYSGLAFRGSRELHNVSYELPDGTIVPEILGDRHPWMVLRATVDGGVNRTVSLGMIDHPTNPRSPSPWYCRSGVSYTLANAAFLFHEAMPVAEGEILHFQYRVLYRDGMWQPGEFKTSADVFRESARAL